MKGLFLLGVLITLFIACDPDPAEQNLEKTSVQLDTHRLDAYVRNSDKKYYLVFESGLGDGAAPWLEKNIVTELQKEASILLYDRAGYEKSQKGPAPRDIPQLSSELAKVVTTKVPADKKVILVAHSLGAFIVRDYALKNQNRVAGIVFVDPSHEAYNRPTHEIEDLIYNQFKAAYGENFGGTQEARQLREDTEYMDKLADLPNIPIMVLTSMKTSSSNDAADRQNWYDAHEQLKTGITDFEHIKTLNAGHYIHREQPALVIEAVKTLLSKL